MKIQDLAVYCRTIEINCDICEHKRECKAMQAHLEDLSPYGVVKMVDNNENMG
jgi:hypothetical protein